MSNLERRLFAATILARDATALEALCEGRPVPRHRLALDILGQLGEPADGGPVALDDDLVLRLELLGQSPADTIAARDRLPARLEKTNAPTQKSDKQSDVLISLARANGAELFHDHDSVAWARIDADGHYENLQLRRRDFKTWLRHLYYLETEGAPNQQAMQDALGVLEGTACFEGEAHAMCVRIGEKDGVVYHDLGDDLWRAVAVSRHGWEVVAEPPVRFRRANGARALPLPVGGGLTGELRPFLNVSGEDDFVLFVGCLVQAFRAQGPYLGYASFGEQGSAKSTRARVFRALIDPNSAPLRTSPRDERDLLIAATNSWIVSIDNLSYLPPWLSDALCRLATGGGLATRTLYTDADETIFDAQRPMLINGIEEVATRGDLLDRLVIAECTPIPEEERQTEAEFWRAFEEARPRIYGALLDAVSCALRNVDGTRLERLPRMADAARWITAAEPALGWAHGTFLAALSANRRDSDELVLESSPLAQLVIALAGGGFYDTASHLLDYLNAQATDEQQRARSWPKNGNALSGKLRRLAPTLRRVGVEVETGIREPGGKRRLVTVTRRLAQEPAVTPVTDFTAQGDEPASTGADNPGRRDAAATRGDATAVAPEPTVTPAEPLATGTRDARDGSDAASAPRSAAVAPSEAYIAGDETVQSTPVTDSEIDALIDRMPDLRDWPREEVKRLAPQLLAQEAKA